MQRLLEHFNNDGLETFRHLRCNYSNQFTYDNLYDDVRLGPLTKNDYSLFVSLAHELTGLDTKHKIDFFGWFIGELTKYNKCTSYMEYYLRLKNKNSEQLLQQFIDVCAFVWTNNRTCFRREHMVYDYLGGNILKEFNGQQMRIWSAACSSGEEPYSIAMEAHDYAQASYSQPNVKIVASDISEAALEKAMRGTYRVVDLYDAPKGWVENYFDDSRTVLKFIKDCITFRNINIADNKFDFENKFHIIFCKYILMYFDYEKKVEILSKLYNELETGGYLFLGMRENTAFVKESLFKEVWSGIYKKN